ncbi:MAG: aldehyde ferredoxin oxidoreductase C-terminal domain-containing protein, partial [Candidatus Bathyarchaeia archaeon]
LTAERICNLRRAFNTREGITRKDEGLHQRFTQEPMPGGRAKGQVVHLDVMLDEYYENRGWDRETGLPYRKTLERVGLKEVADELEKLGKLAG